MATPDINLYGGVGVGACECGIYNFKIENIAKKPIAKLKSMINGGRGPRPRSTAEHPPLSASLLSGKKGEREKGNDDNERDTG